mgnify:FL=1
MSACELNKDAFPPLPILPVKRLHRLRTTFGTEPPSRLRVNARQILGWSGEHAHAHVHVHVHVHVHGSRSWGDLVGYCVRGWGNGGA